MAFHLNYYEDGKYRRRQFGSYYECVVEKERLRKAGINARYSESGQDVTRSCEKPCRVGKGDRELVKNFLKMCDRINNFHDFKSVVK